MALRQCDKCGETVDEARAFCSGCGNAFVEEEKRRDASKFDELEHTVQFGQTMYNQMLEDMGLATSTAPNPVQKRIEVIEPIKSADSAAPHAKKPIAQTAAKAGNLKLYILCGVAVILLVPIALASVIMIVLEIWSRLR